MRSFIGIVAGVLAAMLGTTPAAAQTAFRIGPSMTAIAAAVRGTNSAYDFKNGQYLVVSAYGGLNGVFVTGDGVLGAPFVIPTGDFAHFPGVAYSPDLFGGAGGFLVTWHQSFGQGALVHARFVSATGVLGPEIVAPGCTICAVSTGGSWWEAVADVAYSTTSKEFLVVWQGAGITAQRIDLNGQLVGGNFQVTPAGAYGRDPAVVYNPTTNEFMVSFGSEDNASPFAGFQRIAAGSGALVGPEGIVGRARGVYITEVAYNSTTNQYLVAWYQGGTYGVLVDASGTPLTGVTLLSVAVTAYDALGIDYNASSRTFLMVSHTQTPEDGAVEISGAGLIPDIPIVATAAGGSGNFYPKVSSRVGKPEWLLTTATNFAATTVQRLGSTASGGGTPPPPPPPPPPPSCTSSLSPTGMSVMGPGYTFPVSVTLPASCAWSATSSMPWLEISSNATASGPGTVIVTVQRNPSRTARTGWVTIAGQSVTVQQAGYNPAATSDLDGDGYSDIVWQYQPTGALSWWRLQNTSVIYGGALPTPSDPSWKVVGSGDLNGDTRSDLVLQKGGTVVVWLWTINGYIGIATAKDVDPHWRIRAVGDLNGDGNADIVWQHDTVGWVAVWFMNGSDIISAMPLTVPQQPNLDWLIVGAGDINGDGKADILWQNQSTGVLLAWLMSGAQVWGMDGLTLYTPDLNWKVMGVGDVNGDGFADLLWENIATGQLQVWTLRGYAIRGTGNILSGNIPAVVDPNWRIVGPG